MTTTKTVRKVLPPGCQMSPADLVGAFKEAGFQFDSEVCPIRFKKPNQIIKNPDGSTTFIQVLTLDAEKV